MEISEICNPYDYYYNVKTKDVLCNIIVKLLFLFLAKWWGWGLLCGFGWWFHFMAPFLAKSELKCTWLYSLALRKRGIWPTVGAVKGCVLVLVRGCLGRVGCVFGGCWAVWRRCVFRAREGLLWWVGMYRMGGKGLIRRENAWVGLKVLLSASAGVGWGAVCCSVVAEGYSASHDGGKSSSCR